MLVAALAAKPGWSANRKVSARSRWPITSCRVGGESRLDLADRVAGIAQDVEQRRLVPLGRGRVAHGHRHAARIAHQHRHAPSLAPPSQTRPGTPTHDGVKAAMGLDGWAIDKLETHGAVAWGSERERSLPSLPAALVMVV